MQCIFNPLQKAQKEDEYIKGQETDIYFFFYSSSLKELDCLHKSPSPFPCTYINTGRFSLPQQFFFSFPFLFLQLPLGIGMTRQPAGWKGLSPWVLAQANCCPFRQHILSKGGVQTQTVTGRWMVKSSYGKDPTLSCTGHILSLVYSLHRVARNGRRVGPNVTKLITSVLLQFCV